MNPQVALAVNAFKELQRAERLMELKKKELERRLLHVREEDMPEYVARTELLSQ